MIMFKAYMEPFGGLADISVHWASEIWICSYKPKVHEACNAVEFEVNTIETSK